MNTDIKSSRLTKKKVKKVRVVIWEANENLKVNQIGNHDDGVAEQESQAVGETNQIKDIKE